MEKTATATATATTNLSPLARLTSELQGNSWQSFIKKNITATPKVFVNNVITMAKANTQLAQCSTQSIVFATMKATALNLPMGELGYAYVLPYYNSKTKLYDAQFQMGYKGYIQLAIRSAQFKRLECDVVYEGENLQDWKERVCNYFGVNKKGGKIIGYCAYFLLLNGFEKQLFMSTEEMKQHANTYSLMAKSGKGLWANEQTFDAMAKKTCIKLLISKYAPMSVEMQQAVLNDQKVYSDNEEGRYLDNTKSIKKSLLDDDEDEEKSEAIIIEQKTTD